jgi:hypothetical protein
MKVRLGAVRWKFTDVSEESTASIFSAEYKFNQVRKKKHVAMRGVPPARHLPVTCFDPEDGRQYVSSKRR